MLQHFRSSDEVSEMGFLADGFFQALIRLQLPFAGVVAIFLPRINLGLAHLHLRAQVQSYCNDLQQRLTSALKTYLADRPTVRSCSQPGQSNVG